MITLPELETWLTNQLQHTAQASEGEDGPRSRAYQAALASLARHNTAQDIATCIRAWARGLPKLQENEGACLTAESIATHIEASYSWDLYTYGFGVRATHRVEGPFTQEQQAQERSLALWNETGNYHTGVLIGGTEEQRLRHPPRIRYYQEYLDAEKTLKAEGCIVLVLPDGRAYTYGDLLRPVFALEYLLTLCRELDEQEVERAYPELVQFARAQKT